MESRGIYAKNCELIGYLVGSAVYDLDDNQTGYLRDNVIYTMNDKQQWQIQGDGLFTPSGDSVGYLGAQFQER